MNCVIERRRAEEFIDAPGKTMQLPFGLNMQTEPKKQRVTGERMAIICESRSEPTNLRPEPAAEQIPHFLMHAPQAIQRYPVPYGAMPQQYPLTHMPHQMGPPPLQQHVAPPPPSPAQQQQPQPQQQTFIRQFGPQILIRQIPNPQQQMQQQHQMPPQRIMPMHQMMPSVPDQVMQAPKAEQQEEQQPEVRIQLQRIPFPIADLEDLERQVLREIPIPMQRGGGIDQMAGSQMQVQRIPLSVALQRAGITPQDLQNIQRMAEERIKQELSQLSPEDISNSSSADNDSSSEEEDSSSSMSSSSSSSSSSSGATSSSTRDNSDQKQNQLPQILQMGRVAYGRSLVTPVRIPVNLMQQITEANDEPQQQDRPHCKLYKYFYFYKTLLFNN